MRKPLVFSFASDFDSGAGIEEISRAPRVSAHTPKREFGTTLLAVARAKFRLRCTGWRIASS